MRMYSQSLRSAQNSVRAWLQDRALKVEDMHVHQWVIITDIKALYRKLANELDAQRNPDWLHDDIAPLHFSRLSGMDFTIVMAMPSGSAFSAELEELAVLGARQFIGIFDAIGVGIGSGKLVHVENVLCSDGVSLRYSMGHTEINASYRLSKFIHALLNMEEIKYGEARAGGIDTPYLITGNDLNYMERNGIHVLSSNISVLYSFCYYAGLECCALGIVSEDLKLKPRIPCDKIYTEITSMLKKHILELALL
jgi:uridine phosphorylase